MRLFGNALQQYYGQITITPPAATVGLQLFSSSTTFAQSITVLSGGGGLATIAGAAISALSEWAGNGNTAGSTSLAVGQSAAGASTILARGAQSLAIGVNAGGQITIASGGGITLATAVAASSTLSAVGLSSSSGLTVSAGGASITGALSISDSTGSVWGAPTGGAQGAGTINVAGNVFVNGVQLGFAGIPQNSQSAPYTTVLADANKHIYHPSADTTARTFTIAANASVAYPIGTAISFVNDTSGGVVTIAINTDTLVFLPSGGTGSRSLAANGQATALKVTATRWVITGVGLT